MTVTYQCRCGESIELTDYGWVHVNGGGARMEKCLDCGWKGSRPGGHRNCPACHSGRLMDDHIAEP